MKKFLLQTSNSTGPLIARVMLGAVMFPHGAQKMLGWFGGNGFSGTMGYFTTQLHSPLSSSSWRSSPAR